LLAALLVAAAVAAPPAAAHPPDWQRQAQAEAAARSAAWQEAASLAEAVARLAAARARIAATGRVPLRYTEQQLRAMARAGQLGHTRFLVRLVPNAPDPAAKLGFPRAFGKLPLWVASFEELEACDSDPEVITRVLGLNVDPRARYHLLILQDLGADADQRPEIVIPTRDHLLAIAARDLADATYTPAGFEAVLAKPYRIPYHLLMDAFYKRGFREYLPDDVERFVATTPALADDPAAEKRFRTRLRLHAQLGASEWFRGNGCTFMTGGGQRELGVHEIFVLDPKPLPIGAYAQAGKLAVVPCEPLTKPGPLVFVEPDGRR